MGIHFGGLLEGTRVLGSNKTSEGKEVLFCVYQSIEEKKNHRILFSTFAGRTVYLKEKH